MNQLLKKGIVALLAAAFAFQAYGCGQHEEPTAPTLVVATYEKHADAMNRLADAFNSKNSDVQVSVRVYGSENEKNYYLSHNADDADFYTFDYALDAENYADKLYALNRLGTTNRYLVGTINYLRTNDDLVYVLPTDGLYLTQCYNVGLLNACNLEIPTTITELVSLTGRLRKYVKEDMVSASATVGGKDSVLFALMSMAYPLYLNTARGTDFFNRFISGEASILDDEYVKEWTNVFEHLKILYENGFYSLADLDATLTDGIDRFNSGKYFAMQNSAKVFTTTDFTDRSDFRYAPFVGNTERDGCIGSIPSFFLGLSAKTGLNNNTKAKAKKFLDFFATDEGQACIRKESITETKEYVSYLKNTAAETPDIFADVQQKIDEGRFFLADIFYYSFSYCIDDVISYLSDDINLERMLEGIDRKIREGKNAARNPVAKITTSYDFDPDKLYTERTFYGDFYANALASADYVDAVLVPSKYVRCALLEGILTENELESVFPDHELVYAEITAKTFAEIYRKIQDGTLAAPEGEGGCYPLAPKISVRNGKSVRPDGSELKDDEKIFVLIPKDVAMATEEIRIGKETTVKQLLLSYFRRETER